MRLQRPVLNVVLFGMLVVAAFTLGALRARDVGRSAASVVATVNGSAIAVDDLEVRLAEILPVASYHGQVEPDRLLALRRTALDELVLDELIYRESIAQGRVAAPKDIDADLAAAKARFDDEASFELALKENHLTEEEFRGRLAKSTLVREARAARARQVVTEADIAAYYEANASKFLRPEQAHLLEILVRVDPADPASAPKAEREAHRLFARIAGGEDFGAVARSHSDDEYRVKDGDMGLVHRGRLDEAFDAAVFQAPVNRLGVARSLYGFQVFKVLERRPPTQLSLAEAGPIIRESLERRRRDEAVRAWHTRLLAAARVEIRDPALRAARPADLAAPIALAARLRTPAREGR